MTKYKTEEERKAAHRESMQRWYQSQKGQEYHRKKKENQPRKQLMTEEEKAASHKESVKKWYNSDKGAAFRERMKEKYYQNKNIN